MDLIKHFKQLNDFDFDLISKIKFFLIVQNSDVIIVLKNDSVFVFGQNIYGNLGSGHRKEVKELTQSNRLSNKEFIDICFGKYHVLGLTRSGECISWGDNKLGQLGYETNHKINKPKLIEYFTENNLIITSISCGFRHSMVLTNNGVVYAFGKNDYKQLGSEESTGFPQKVEIGSTITAISCGGYHCLALNNSGHVFIWGYNKNRQCSENKSLKHCLPLIVEIPSKVCQISCGFTISLVLTEDKQIYSIGCIECCERKGWCTHNSNIIQKPFGENQFTEIGSHCSENVFIVKSIDGYCYVWNSGKLSEKTEYKCLNIAFNQFSEFKMTFRPVFMPKYFLDISSKRLQTNIGQHFDNPKDFDFIFKFNDKQIFVHKVILKIQCNHFKTLFSEKWDKLDSNVLEMKDISYSTYYSFLKYLYLDVIEVENEDIYELYDLANSYFEEELKSVCLKLIEDNISMENVLIVFSFSQKYELQELELHCLKFCSNKWNQLIVSEHYQTFDENITRKLITRAAQLNLFN